MRRGGGPASRLVGSLEHSDDCVVLADLDGRVRWWNRAAEPFFTQERRPVRVQDAVVDGDDRLARILRGVCEGSVWHGDAELVDGDGRQVPHSLSVTPDLGGRRRVVGFTLVARDATTQRRREAALAHAALVDPLTGTASGPLLEDRLGHLSLRAATTGRTAALFVLDVDRFGVVNDRLGRGEGDELLRLVAQRLRDELEPADTVARTGGDEFAVLVERVDGPDGAKVVADALLDALRAPFELDGGTVLVAVSIGVAPIDGHLGAAELLRRAELAMHRAKNRGGARYAVHDDHAGHRIDRRLQIEWAIRERLEQHTIAADFQPVVDLGTGALAFAEARLRTDWPELGRVDPHEVLEATDRSDLSGALCRRIVELAAEAARGWPAQIAVSFDVPAGALSAELPDAITAAFAAAGLGCDRAIAEVAETAVVEAGAEAVAVLEAVGATGARIAIDDFGAGAGSLAMLRTVPVDLLKIDPSLLDELSSDATRAVIGAVLGVAEVLELTVVAPGLDDDHALEVARSLGCDLGQGDRIGPPGPAADLGPDFRMPALD